MLGTDFEMSWSIFLSPNYIQLSGLGDEGMFGFLKLKEALLSIKFFSFTGFNITGFSS